MTRFSQQRHQTEINMVIEDKTYSSNKMEVPQVAGIGKSLKATLLQARVESRVVVGLSAAVKLLSAADPQESLFCVLAPPNKGDSATHMHEVLLQAFCFENDIYIVHVDSSEKLGRLLNLTAQESCVLVQKSWSSNNEEHLTEAENALVDYCEVHWDAPKQPVIKLPEL